MAENVADSATKVQTRSTTRIAVWMLLLLALSLILRALFLGRQSLWIDESASWWNATGDLPRTWRTEVTNPPLYYFLLHFWIRFFGASEAGLRSLNLIPSVLSVWLIFRLGRSLLSAEIAWLAAFYQTISTFQIFYAQEARCFSFLVCFLLLSTLLLWKAMENSAGKRFTYYATYALVTALALYTHFIAVFFLVAHGCFVLLRRRRHLPGYLVSAVAAVVLFSPWLSIMLKAAGAGGQQGRRYLLLKLPQAYFSFMFGDSLIPLDEQAVTHIRETLTANALFLGTALLASAVLCVFAWYSWKRWQDRMLYVAVNATVPVFLAFVVSFKVMLFDERYLIAASPFVYLIVSAAVGEALSNWRQGRWAGRLGLTAVAGYSALLLVSLYHYYFDPRFGKEQWRDAVAYLDSASSPQDFLVLDPDYLQTPYRYYQRRDLPYLPAIPSAASEELLRNRIDGHPRVWLITAHYDQEPVAKIIKAMFPLESHRVFPNGHGIEVSCFRTDFASVSVH
jgi:mannosyltransferase